MADLVFVAVIVAFFALATGFVVVCDRIIGPDELIDEVTAESRDRVRA